MSIGLKGKSLLDVGELSKEQFVALLDLSSELKAAKRNGTEQPLLKQKEIVLIFEKTSTRTRCAFEVAAYDQGAHVTYLGPEGSQIGHKESMKDTARVLGRMYDAIEYRGFSQELVEILSTHAGVPVYNGLTDEFHPTQMLADMLTMREHSGKPLERIAYAYMGDAHSNMGRSLLETGAILGMDVRIIAPREIWPDEAYIAQHRQRGATSGARITVTDDIAAGVKGVDFIHTDVWVSMGEAHEVWVERIELLRPYQVNMDVIRQTGNPDVKFMHCLPAFHNRETKVGEEIYEKFGLDCMEVTEEVFESPRSIVFDQAENRMHTIKAILVATLAG
ncbi:MAG TPA: ornithine carbamoyltransferase [Thermomicrobiales bacterium]|nr:ornithine carbamoyltransferase [Thermomicrobiales bacterium]